jgi:hypothetical protein
MIHHFRHLLLLPLLNDPALAPSVATSIAPWTTPDPSLAPSVAPAIAPWSTARTIYHSFFAPWSIAWSTHRSSYCSLVHRLHHPSLFILHCNPSLATSIAPSTLPDPPLAPSIAPWSIARTNHRSLKCSLTLIAPSILPDQPLAPAVALSIDPWFTARTIHRFSITPWSITCTIQHSFFRSLNNLLHNPSLLILLSGLSLEPCIDPSIASWSIACNIHRSFNCSLINHLCH